MVNGTIFFMFVFLLQFIFYFKESILNVFSKKFLFSLVDVFSFNKGLPLSGLISVFIFLILLTCCFGGYFNVCKTGPKICIFICGIGVFFSLKKIIKYFSYLVFDISCPYLKLYCSKKNDEKSLEIKDFC